jgi:hypothetical protein
MDPNILGRLNTVVEGTTSPHTRPTNYCQPDGWLSLVEVQQPTAVIGPYCVGASTDHNG